MTALLAVSITPTAAECKAAADPNAVCPLCHMTMAEMAAMGVAMSGSMGARAGQHMHGWRQAHARAAMPAAMRHCRIECCGHHDSLDGLPHLLAPHVASWGGFSPAMAGIVAPAAMMPRLAGMIVPVSSPPPKRV